MVFKKGQAALDFLMTYGWAIALVVIIAAVLFAMGVFDTSNFVGSKAAGFSGISVSSFQLTKNGDLNVALQNQVGKQIELTGVSATIGSETKEIDSLNDKVATGASITKTISGFTEKTLGTSYTSNMTITYKDEASGFEYTTQGTLTGKVS